MPKEVCFRCNNDLVITDEHNTITFYKCDICKRGYAKSAGKSLTDRWLSPISIVIYDIIYVKQKVSDKIVEGNAMRFLKRLDKEKMEALIEDIDDEINNPKQKLVDMLDLKGTTEEIARDYLRRLSIEIKKHQL